MGNLVNFLTEDEKKKLTKNHGVLWINGDKYYYSYCNNCHIRGKIMPVYGVEQLMEELARKVGINCAHYELINVNGNYYSLSKDISCGFNTFEKMEFDYHSLSKIQKELEKRNYDKIDDIMLSFIKVYLFDLLFLNGDRHANNWGMTSTNELYILDNEFSFDDLYPPQLTMHEDDDYYSNKGGFFAIYGGDDNSCSSQLYLDEIEYFLSNSSSLYSDLFMEMYDKLNPLFVEEMIKKVEKINNMSLPHLYDRLNIYKEYYEGISKLLKHNKKK